MYHYLYRLGVKLSHLHGLALYMNNFMVNIMNNLMNNYWEVKLQTTSWTGTGVTLRTALWTSAWIK